MACSGDKAFIPMLMYVVSQLPLNPPLAGLITIIICASFSASFAGGCVSAFVKLCQDLGLVHNDRFQIQGVIDFGFKIIIGEKD